MSRARGPKIGEAGEQMVDAWARRADLRCFKPDPDIIGVDRFVELTAPLAPGETLDLAERSTLTWLQIKSTTSNALSWTVKLDICARFVDADAPTFFLLLRMSADETLRDAHLLHVDEAFGEEVLRALRELDPAQERGRLHKHDFRVRWSAAHRIDPSTLREHLLRAIGPSASYAERKRQWRESVGYPKLPVRIRVQLSTVEMARHLLGQVESVHAEIPFASETRFGIERPLPHLMQPAFLTLGLTEGADATFRVRRARELEDVPGKFWTILHAFQGESLPDDADVWRFEGGLLHVLTKGNGTAELELSYESARESSLQARRRSATAASLLFTGECELSLGLRGKRVSLRLSETERPAALDLSPIEVAVDFAELVGIDETTGFTGSELLRWHEDRVEALNTQVDVTSSMSLALPRGLAAKLSKAGTIRLVQPMVARLGKTFAVTHISRDATAFTVNDVEDGRISIDASSASNALGVWKLTEDLDTVHRWLTEQGALALKESDEGLAVVLCGYSREDLERLVLERESPVAGERYTRD